MSELSFREKLFEAVKEAVASAEGVFADGHGDEKKQMVIDWVLAFRKKYLDTRLPDFIEDFFVKIILDGLIEKAWQLLTENGVINVGKANQFTAQTL